MQPIETPVIRSERRALRDLATRSDRQGIVQLAGHGAALLTTGGLVWLAPGPVWLLPALLVHGIVLVFLFAPLHETVHKTAFRSHRLNDVVAWICGALLVLPPSYFRAFHFAHHRHTQDPARDPELARPKPSTVREYIRHVSGLPYWRERIATTLRHARGRVDETFITARERGRIAREARCLLGVYLLGAAGSLALGSAALLWLWVLPALLGQPFLRAYLLAEHTGCPLIPDMLRNSHHQERGAGAPARLEHALPRRAPRPSGPALPCPADGARAPEERIAIQADGYVEVNREILSALRDAA